MDNIILGILMVLIIGSASFYVYKAKKSGKKCVGCPNACGCDSEKATCSECERK